MRERVGGKNQVRWRFSSEAIGGVWAASEILNESNGVEETLKIQAGRGIRITSA
jgi:hypothetical protein